MAVLLLAADPGWRSAGPLAVDAALLHDAQALRAALAAGTVAAVPCAEPDGGASCTAGGPGATACSIPSSRGGSCQVTCSMGSCASCTCDIGTDGTCAPGRLRPPGRVPSAEGKNAPACAACRVASGLFRRGESPSLGQRRMIDKPAGLGCTVREHR